MFEATHGVAAYMLLSRLILKAYNRAWRHCHSPGKAHCHPSLVDKVSFSPAHKQVVGQSDMTQKRLLSSPHRNCALDESFVAGTGNFKWKMWIAWRNELQGVKSSSKLDIDTSLKGKLRLEGLMYRVVWSTTRKCIGCFGNATLMWMDGWSERKSEHAQRAVKWRMLSPWKYH